MLLNLDSFILDSRPARRIYRRLYGAAIVCLWLISSSVQATIYQSTADLHVVAKKFILSSSASDNPPQIEFSRLDPRLKLAKCDPEKLQAFFPPGAQRTGNTTVGIRCDGPKSWKLYIQVQLKFFAQVLVATRSLGRGTLLQKSDFFLQKQDVSRLQQGYFVNARIVSGRTLKRSLAQGKVLLPSALRPDHLVRRGDVIVIMVQSKGLKVQVQGKALMDGSHGQMIRVQNSRSRRKLQAKVIARGIVEVQM